MNQLAYIWWLWRVAEYATSQEYVTVAYFFEEKAFEKQQKEKPSVSPPFGSDGEKSTCSAGDLSSSQGWEDRLEESMATHASILAWRIPMDGGAWGDLESMGLHRVGHN